LSWLTAYIINQPIDINAKYIEMSNQSNLLASE
jgi:hypothetical protein